MQPPESAMVRLAELPIVLALATLLVLRLAMH